MIRHPSRLRVLCLLLGAAVLGSPNYAQQFTPGNILVSSNNQLFEFTPGGVQLQVLAVPYPMGFPEDALDVVVDSVGRAHVLNVSTFSIDYISTYAPSTGNWTHSPVTASLGNVSDGDLSILGSTLYTKSQSILIPSYAPSSISVPGRGVGEISAGLDGLLYALDSGSPRAGVRVLDPDTLAVLDSFSVSSSNNTRGIAVVPSGDLYTADWDGNLYHYDPSGQVLQNAIGTGSFNLLDVDVGTDGTLVAGSRFGDVIVTDTAFSSLTSFNVGRALTYVGIVPQPVVGTSVDVGVLAITAPGSGASLGTGEILTVDVANYGETPQSNVPLTYTVSGPVNAVVTENLPGPLGPLDTSTFSFTTPLDLSLPGTYTIQVSTLLVGDEDPTNDAASGSIIHQAEVTVFPYFEGFELDPGDFLTTGIQSSWEHGAPSGFFITAAATGTNAWVTNLDGVYNGSELSYLTSPPFDCSSFAVDPLLRFSHAFQLGIGDSSWVEVSIDGGPFTKLGSTSDPASFNWYNNTGGNYWDRESGALGTWRTAQNVVPGAAGSTVVIRWVLQAGSFVLEDGVGVDDVELLEAPFGSGQAPQLGRAVLDVNSATEVIGFPVSTNHPGPYFSTVAAGGTLDLHFEGLPNQPIVLLGGTRSVGAHAFPGGQLDVFPFQYFASGLDPVGLGQFFFTNLNGTFDFSVSVPQGLVGQEITFQAGIFSGPDSFSITNAVVTTFSP